MDKKEDAFDAMRNACQRFVDKVETGKARSKESYKQMKDALALITEAKPKITIEKEKLQQLVDNFYDMCSSADELNIYEHEEADNEMQEMKTWVDENFGRKIH